MIVAQRFLLPQAIRKTMRRKALARPSSPVELAPVLHNRIRSLKFPYC
jgi:hypothetical protein